MAVSIQRVVTGKWKENCYIVSSENNDALIIDPGEDFKDIVSFIETKKLKPIAILLTHGHYDHIGCVEDIKEMFSIQVYMHSGDSKLLKQANFYKVLFLGATVIRIPKIDYDLKDQSELNLNDFIIEIFHLPGHTEGSVCYRIENSLFIGDLFFKDAIGRIDLPGSNKEKIKASILEVSKMSGELMIFPGHGASAKLDHILSNNTEIQKMLNEHSN